MLQIRPKHLIFRKENQVLYFFITARITLIPKKKTSSLGSKA